jgi:hypothetical protein
MGELTRCRTCNYPLTTAGLILRGACLPHGIDNRLEMEAGMYDADADAEADEAARSGVYLPPDLGCFHFYEGDGPGARCSKCGEVWPEPRLYVTTLLADDGLAVVARGEGSHGS